MPDPDLTCCEGCFARRDLSNGKRQSCRSHRRTEALRERAAGPIFTTKTFHTNKGWRGRPAGGARRHAVRRRGDRVLTGSLCPPCACVADARPLRSPPRAGRPGYRAPRWRQAACPGRLRLASGSPAGAALMMAPRSSSPRLRRVMNVLKMLAPWLACRRPLGLRVDGRPTPMPPLHGPDPSGFEKYLSVTEERPLETLHPPEEDAGIVRAYLPPLSHSVGKSLGPRFASVLSAPHAADPARAAWDGIRQPERWSTPARSPRRCAPR